MQHFRNTKISFLLDPVVKNFAISTPKDNSALFSIQNLAL